MYPPPVVQTDAKFGACLISSGLFQSLVDGTLLLLATDPAAYPQATAEQEQQLWLTLKSASSAAMFISSCLAAR